MQSKMRLSDDLCMLTLQPIQICLTAQVAYNMSPKENLNCGGRSIKPHWRLDQTSFNKCLALVTISFTNNQHIIDQNSRPIKSGLNERLALLNTVALISGHHYNGRLSCFHTTVFKATVKKFVLSLFCYTHESSDKMLNSFTPIS